MYSLHKYIKGSEVTTIQVFNTQPVSQVKLTLENEHGGGHLGHKASTGYKASTDSDLIK